MTIKHTPAPWSVEGWTEHGAWVVGPEGETGLVRVHPEPRALQEANAKLIAAAPALADALEGVLSSIDEHGSYLDSEYRAIASAALRAAGRL